MRAPALKFRRVPTSKPFRQPMKFNLFCCRGGVPKKTVKGNQTNLDLSPLNRIPFRGTPPPPMKCGVQHCIVIQRDQGVFVAKTLRQAVISSYLSISSIKHCEDRKQ